MPEEQLEPIQYMEYKELPRTVPFSLSQLGKNMQDILNNYLEYDRKYGLEVDLVENPRVEKIQKKEKLDQDIWEQLIKEEK